MKTKGSFLVVLAPTLVFAGVAAAQQQPPPGYQQQPPPGYQQQPPPGYQQQPPPGYQQEPPPGYQQQPPPGYAPPPGYQPPPPGYPPPQPMDSSPTPVLFGAPGQFVISDDLFISAVTTRETPPNSIVATDSRSTSSVLLQPAFDIFVARGFSLGGQVIIGFSFADAASSGTGSDSTFTQFGLFPRIGYNFALGSKASIWPRLAAGYLGTSFDAGDGSASTSGYRFTFRAFVPFLFHPVPHFFIGAGPTFSTDLVSKLDDADYTRFSQYGIQSTIGGYFGGK
jgi:hypothetical protein